MLSHRKLHLTSDLVIDLIVKLYKIYYSSKKVKIKRRRAKMLNICLFSTLFQAQKCVFISHTYLSTFYIAIKKLGTFLEQIYCGLFMRSTLWNWYMVEHWILPNIWLSIGVGTSPQIFISLVNLLGYTCVNKAMLSKINPNICTITLLVQLFIPLQRVGQRAGIKEKSQTH